MKSPGLKKINTLTILTGIVVFVTLIIGIVFIYMPYQSRNKSLRKQILHERNRNLLIGNIRALDKHLKFYRKRIPEEGRGVSWLLNTVSDMATKEQIEVSSIKPGSPEDRSGYTALYIEMDTVSTYDQLGRFLSRVESQEKFLRVENIDIKRMDLGEAPFDSEATGFQPFDVKANIVISTIVLKKKD